MIAGSRPPSIYTGFAPRDFAPAYPTLWNRCVGAWCPSIAPTGNILHDWSGCNVDLNGSGLTLNTTWKMEAGGYATDMVAASSNVFSATQTQQFRFTGAMSVSAWFAADLFTTQIRGIIGVWRSQTGNTNQRKWSLAVNTSSQLSGGVSSDGSTTNVASGATTLVAGTWYHAVMVYVPSTSVTLYLNGVQDAQITTTIASSLFDSTAPVWWGLRNDSTTTSFYFDGRIDDVRVYDRAITEAEIEILTARRRIAYEPAQLGRRFVPAGAAPAGGPFPHFIRRSMAGGMCHGGLRGGTV